MADVLLTHIIGNLSNSEKELQAESARVLVVKRNAKIFTDAVSKKENNTKYGVFSSKLFALLSECVKKQHYIWQAFGDLRTKRLPDLWTQFLMDIKCSEVMKDPLFVQITSEALLKVLIQDKCSDGCQSPSASTQACVNKRVTLTKDEENIIRYACGYVGMKLYKKFIQKDGEKAKLYVNCIANMRAAGDESTADESLLHYTREWTQKVNRGGLFEVSDAAFQLFVSIELTMRTKLRALFSSFKSSTSYVADRGSAAEGNNKAAVIRTVVGDSKVLYYWNTLSSGIQAEEDSCNLLEQVVTVWLTIRGFSITKAWMEDYKNALHKTSTGKKSLRKELKKN